MPEFSTNGEGGGGVGVGGTPCIGSDHGQLTEETGSC